MSSLSLLRSIKRKLNDNTKVVKYIFAKTKEEFDEFYKVCDASDEKITVVAIKLYEIFG